MAAAFETTDRTPTLHPEFVTNMVRTFDDSNKHGVHLLFNAWWPHAPELTIERYLANFRETAGADAFLAERYLAEPLSLEANLATNYKGLHDHRSAAGQLDRMPVDLRYAIIRGFQIHDILHVITGYTPSGLDELALQAFCLAPLQFPYFGMWMATTTARMTFLQPDTIVPAMDAISQGWQFGRTVRNLQFAPWERLLGEPLASVRPRYGIPAEGYGIPAEGIHPARAASA